MLKQIAKCIYEKHDFKGNIFKILKGRLNMWLKCRLTWTSITSKWFTGNLGDVVAVEIVQFAQSHNLNSTVIPKMGFRNTFVISLVSDDGLSHLFTMYPSIK